MVFGVVGQLLIASVTGVAGSYVSIVIFSIGICMTTIVIPMLGSALFGYQASLSTNGIFLAMAAAAGLISGPVTNICYDKMGSYRPIFTVAAFTNIGVIMLFFLLFALAKRDRKLPATN